MIDLVRSFPERPRNLKPPSPGMFFCPRLAANITPLSCVYRQGMQPLVTPRGTDVSKPEEQYCRSGECQIGATYAGVYAIFFDLNVIITAQRALKLAEENGVRYAAVPGVLSKPRRTNATNFRTGARRKPTYFDLFESE